jgi:hypothetical protein
MVEVHVGGGQPEFFAGSVMATVEISTEGKADFDWIDTMHFQQMQCGDYPWFLHFQSKTDESLAFGTGRLTRSYECEGSQWDSTYECMFRN